MVRKVSGAVYAARIRELAERRDGISATEFTSAVFRLLHDPTQCFPVVQRPWIHRGKLGGE